MRIRSISETLGFVLICGFVSACGAGGSYTKTLSNSSLGSNNPPAPSPTPGGFVPPPATALSAQVKTLITNNCLGCHSNFLDINSMIDIQVLVPGNPGASKVNIRVQAGTMPPTGPLNAASKQLIFDWIAAGPAAFQKVGPMYDAATDLFYVPR